MLLFPGKSAWEQGNTGGSFEPNVGAGSENSCMRMKAELPDTIVRVGGNPALPAKEAETLDAVAYLIPFGRCV